MECKLKNWRGKGLKLNVKFFVSLACVGACYLVFTTTAFCFVLFCF
jgi:hypothetical protein